MRLQEIQALFIAEDIISKLKSMTDKEAAQNNNRLHSRYDVSEMADLATESFSFIEDSINEQIGRIIDAEVETIGFPIVRHVMLLRHKSKLLVTYNIVSRKVMADCALETVKDRLLYLHDNYNATRKQGEPYVIDVILPDDVNEYKKMVAEKIAKPMGFSLNLLQVEGLPDMAHLFFTPKDEVNTSLHKYLKQLRELIVSLIDEDMLIGTLPIGNIRDLELVCDFVNTHATKDKLKHSPARGYSVNASIGTDRNCLEIELILVDPEDRALYLAEMKEAKEAKKLKLAEDVKVKSEDKERAKEEKTKKAKLKEEKIKEQELKKVKYSREREKTIRQKSKDLKPKPRSLLAKKVKSTVSYSDATRTTKAKPKREKKVTTRKIKK